MMEKLPISRSPSKTPRSTPTKTPTKSKKPVPSFSKKQIQYEDDEDDIAVTSSVTPLSKETKQVSSDKVVTRSSPVKPHSTPVKPHSTPKSVAKPSTPSISRTPTVSRATASPNQSIPGKSVSPAGPSRSDSYKQYLSRGGPKALGSKPIPEGLK